MDTLLITSNVGFQGDKLPTFPQEQFKYEPMFFSSSLSYAYNHGGEPTRSFIDSLPPEWRTNEVILDSRVHMLMRDWFPCIPGWHHDDVPRERKDGQPDYWNPSYRSEHAMILFNGDICPTEFAIGEAEFEDVPEGRVYYEKWHPVVEKKIKTGELIRIHAPSSQIIYFNDRTWHQGIKAVADGWRLFIRASKGTSRPVLNEQRKQVQVYLENPLKGW